MALQYVRFGPNSAVRRSIPGRQTGKVTDRHDRRQPPQSGQTTTHDSASGLSLGDTLKVASLLLESGSSAVKAGALVLTFDFCMGVIGIDHKRAKCRTINCTVGLKVWDSQD